RSSVHPTLGGATSRGRSGGSFVSVHPHARGYDQVLGLDQHPLLWFIPTLRGTTWSWPPPSRWCAAHPQSVLVLIVVGLLPAIPVVVVDVAPPEPPAGGHRVGRDGLPRDDAAAQLDDE